MAVTGTLRVIDLLDIIVVAALVALGLVWVRRIRAGRVAMGLLAVVTLYLVARAAGLSLLSGLFEGSFALFVVIVVVIFQKELRRSFETISWPGLVTAPHVSDRGLDVVVETTFDFSQRGVGALIVIPGREAVEPHVSGGVELQGKLSRPLLYSLFDPHSPGHDGAAILEGDRVAKFAVHLPLSTNADALSDRGTRHAAALGLSEQCDALCLVVSEERRLVSLARSGELVEVNALPELRALLADAYTGPGSEPEPGPRPSLARRYWLEALLSLGVVTGLWFVLVAGSVETERTYDLPVRLVDVPVGLTLQGIEPERVRVTFRGPSSALTSATAGDFEVAVDVSLARIGQRSFTISDDGIDGPAGLDVIAVEPRRVLLTVSED